VPGLIILSLWKDANEITLLWTPGGLIKGVYQFVYISGHLLHLRYYKHKHLCTEVSIYPPLCLLITHIPGMSVMTRSTQHCTYHASYVFMVPIILYISLNFLLTSLGGGTNARIFRAQCRGLESQLRNQFRLCYAEGPFPSNPGPDVVSVYEHWGPFRRWLLNSPDDKDNESPYTLMAVERALASTMNHDDMKGASGSWVGLLGFSQGAKLAATLLLLQQARGEAFDRRRPSFRFAVLMAGRAPVCLNTEKLTVLGADERAFGTLPDRLDRLGKSSRDQVEQLISLPTIHVHGLRDKGIEMHRKTLEYCGESSTRIIEWDGDHRLPIKSKDVALVVDAITCVAIETGILG
jgi:hypothetical protein